MPAQILQGNVFDLLPTLKPGSVDAVVTSPPYWLLRDFVGIELNEVYCAMARRLLHDDAPLFQRNGHAD